MGVTTPSATLAEWRTEFARRLVRHLPPGPYYQRPAGEAAAFWDGLAYELARVRYGLSLYVVPLLHPGKATGVALDAWEQALGLPECSEASTETANRQAAAWAKFRAQGNGGQSPAFFVQLVSDRFGLDGATVEEFPIMTCTSDCTDAINGEAWAHTWALVMPMDNYEVMDCTGTCVDYLATWGRDELECLVRKLAPAHTHVLFWYEE